MNLSATRQRTLHGRWFVAWMLSVGVLVAPAQARNFRLPFSTTSQIPHPAVARISVAEQGATSHGTGTLVNVAGQHGLVVTNWHVVRGAVGEVLVEFPDGFRSAARVLKVDKEWDLAALQIWRPAAPPVSMATVAPRPGETLAIAGYGSGQYRTVSGRCTQYVAPGENMPYEMVELSAEARQGDSGGPIFNERGELAGVLFGASRGTTSGSYCGRVSEFLATFLQRPAASVNPVPGDVRSHDAPAPIAEGDTAAAGPTYGAAAVPQHSGLAPLPPVPASPSPPPASPAAGGFARVEPYFGASPRMTPAPAIDLAPSTAVSTFSAPVHRNGTQLAGGQAWADAPAAGALLSSADKPAAAPWEKLVGETPLEQGKSVLAGIGILVVLMRLSNVLAGGRD